MNRGTTLWVGLLIGLALGAGGGWLLGGGSGSAEPTLGPGALGGTRVPALPAQGGGTNLPPNKVAAQEYSGSLGSLLEEVPENPELESSDSNPAAAPTGIISGTVYDDQGQPLSGVVIIGARGGPGDEEDTPKKPIEIPTWRTGDGAPVDQDLREMVKKMVVEELTRRRDTLRVTTDREGKYVLKGIDTGVFHVQAFAPGLTINGASHSRPWEARAGSQVDFVATTLYAIQFDVRLPDGTQPDEATIMSESSDGMDGGWGNSLHETWFKARPEIRVGAGSYAFVAEGGVRQRYKSEPQRVFIDARNRPTNLVLKLKGRTAISGKVLPGGDDPLPNHAVHVMHYQDAPPTDEKLQEDGQSHWNEEGPFGRYKFLDLKPGLYRIGVSTFGKLVYSESVQVAEGQYLEKDLRLPKPDAPVGVVVKVLGPDGNLLRNAQVRAEKIEEEGKVQPWRRWWNRDEVEGVTVRPQPDGTFLVQRTKPDVKVEDGVLIAQAGGFGQRAVAFPTSANGLIEITMERPGILNVNLTGVTKDQLQGTLLSLQGKGSRYLSQVTSSLWPQDTHCSFGPLQPGTYELVLAAQGVYSHAEKVGVTVVSGENSATVAVPGRHKLQVQMPKERATNHTYLRSAEDSSQHAWGGGNPDSKGIVSFEGLFAGEYEIVTNGSFGEESMRVRVPAPGIVNFAPAREAMVRVRELDEGGYLKEVGLRQGDLIIGVDSERFASERPASALLRASLLVKSEGSLLIDRGGHEVTLSVNSEKFLQASDSGQVLEGVRR